MPENSVLALFTDGLIESRHHDLDEGNRSQTAACARHLPGKDLRSKPCATRSWTPNTPRSMATT
jgi:hypothetical protein